MTTPSAELCRCTSCRQPMPCDCCRVYGGFRNEHGYGRPAIGPPKPRNADGHKDGRKQVYLHRWVVEQAEGRPLEAGEVVMHLCDNPPCFRYIHLRRSTQTGNHADMWSKGRGKVPAPMRGARSPHAKLTEDQVRAIRSRRGSAISRVVAAEFGVSGALIRDIWREVVWVDV